MTVTGLNILRTTPLTSFHSSNHLLRSYPTLLFNSHFAFTPPTALNPTLSVPQPKRRFHAGIVAMAASGPGPVHKSEEEWQAILSPEQFRILRQKGTEYVILPLTQSTFQFSLS